MAVSAVTSQKFFANNNQQSYLHVPASTAATVLTSAVTSAVVWLDLSQYENFAVNVMNTVQGTGGSGPTLVDIVAAVDTSGTSLQSIVSSGTIASIAVGDNISVECVAAQIREVGSANGVNFHYVSVRITTSNSGDKQTVTTTLSNPMFPQQNLTPNGSTLH